MSLPDLIALDTEYLGPGLLYPLDRDAPFPLLQRLTVRTSSVDLQGPVQLWAWLRALTPRPSLESFTLNAFSTAGQTNIPQDFLLSLARRHANTLRQFLVNMMQLTLEDMQCICELFPHLEEPSCAIASYDAIRSSFPFSSNNRGLISFLFPHVGIHRACDREGT